MNGKVTIAEMLQEFEVGPPRALSRYYNEGMGEIYISTTTVSTCSHFMHHKASTGTMWTMHWPINIPVGITAYPWFIKNRGLLEHAGPVLLTWLAWLTALIDPYQALKRGCIGNFFYQLYIFFMVTLTMVVIQPLYTLTFYLFRRR